MLPVRPWWKRQGLSGRSRRAGLLAIALAISLGMALLAQWSGWRLLEARAFDYFSTTAPPPLSDRGPVIVAIDEPSFAEIGAQWPWPRSYHALLVESLRKAGATAIGIDIILAEPSTKGGDAELAAAVGPDVVMAADETVIETPHAAQRLLTQPLPMFLQTGAKHGVASIVLDGDGVLRRLPAYGDGFALELARMVKPDVAQPRGSELMQVAGPARSYQTVSYYQALDPTGFLPPGIFKDRIVLVGLSLQSAPAADDSSPDALPTAHTVHTGRLISGVEAQATILDNLLRNLSIAQLPAPMSALVILAGAMIGAACVWRGSSWRSLVFTLAGLAAVTVLAWLALRYGRVFVPPLAPAAALVLVAGAQELRDFAEERRLRAGIVRAFSQYLSPALVERLAANPTQLRLGGETRELTLLFCDVRGFTTISELLKGEPQRLTELINRLLTPLSEVVMAKGGTIDKYIGDCLMAFWNAPLDDPDHALHAVQAAAGMFEALDRLNAELQAEAGASGVPLLRIGIGVNSGTCVVGNMGSERRFDYSALGDAVNLASRLESASKEVGVPLLIGEDTAVRIGDRLPLLPLARISVKGRETPVVVWTMLPGEADPAVGDALRALIALPESEARQQATRLVKTGGSLAGYYERVAAGELDLP